MQSGEDLIAEMRLQFRPSRVHLFGTLVWKVMVLKPRGLNEWPLPVIPDVDLIATSALYVQGTLEPKIRFVGQGDVLVGPRAFRWDIDLHHVQDRLEGNLQTRMDQTNSDWYSRGIPVYPNGEGNTEGGCLSPLYWIYQQCMQRLGRLVGFLIWVKDLLTVVTVVTPNAWLLVPTGYPRPVWQSTN